MSYPEESLVCVCVCVCVYIYIYIYIYQPIGIMVRVFASGPGDQGLIPGWVIPKTQIMILDTSLLNTQYYKVWIKGKSSNPKKRVAASPTPQCNSYWKESLWVTLNYHQLTHIYIYIYIYIYMYIFFILLFMACQPAWVIKCQNHPFRRTAVILFNL